MKKLNEQFFQSAIKLFERKNHCSINSLKQCYDQFLPENKKIDIIPIPVKVSQDYDGTVSIIEDRKSFKGYEIDIASKKKHNRQYLHIKNLPNFMHESAHVLDYFLNPKFVTNVKKMTELGIYDKDYYEIYDKLYYNDELIEKFESKNKNKILEHIKNETEKILENVPLEEKITFLNYIKYGMLTEYNAYNEDYRFMNIIRETRKFKSIKNYKNWNKYYMFPEKIKIVNKILKETLKSERNKIAESIQNQRAKNIFTKFLLDIKNK